MAQLTFATLRNNDIVVILLVIVITFHLQPFQQNNHTFLKKEYWSNTCSIAGLSHWYRMKHQKTVNVYFVSSCLTKCACIMKYFTRHTLWFVGPSTINNPFVDTINVLFLRVCHFINHYLLSLIRFYPSYGKLFSITQNLHYSNYCRSRIVFASPYI